RRGWRLRLYGRAWGDTPEFAEFARPPLDHGEPLRAAYQAAAAHLHISIHTLAHQRVMECALSGGLPLCRLIPELLLTPLRMRAQWAVAVRGQPVEDGAERGAWFAWTDQPESAAYAALLQRLGLPLDPLCWVPRRKLECWRADPGFRPPAPERSAAILADIGETTFATPQRLAELIESAIERPAW